jgi:hypothetical protein
VLETERLDGPGLLQPERLVVTMAESFLLSADQVSDVGRSVLSDLTRLVTRQPAAIGDALAVLRATATAIGDRPFDSVMRAAILTAHAGDPDTALHQVAEVCRGADAMADKLVWVNRFEHLAQADPAAKGTLVPLLHQMLSCGPETA